MAFPSTKGGKLDLDGVVNFPGKISDGTETFWAVQLLQTSITNLPVIIRFIADALEFLYNSPFPRRVHFKIPMPIPNDDGITSAAIWADNVTIVERNGSRRVYKEHCCYLRVRETSDFFTPMFGTIRGALRQGSFWTLLVPPTIGSRSQAESCLRET